MEHRDAHPTPQSSAGPAPPSTDPVCGMKVDPLKAAGSVEHAGTTIYFCGKGCQVKFAASPEKYLPGTETPPRTAGAAQPAAKASPPAASRALHLPDAPGGPAGRARAPARSAAWPWSR